MKSTAFKLLVLLPLALSCRAADPGPVDVSMVQLIANPKQFHKKVVRVIGFLNIEFEGDALYLHKEDYLHCISFNALWMDLPAKVSDKPAINNQYVIVEALFRSDAHGHMGMFIGELTDIKRLDPWSNAADPRTEQYKRQREQGPK